jgi:hypothetical protein
MTLRCLAPIASLALAACSFTSAPAPSPDQTDIATAVTRDYVMRYSQDVCVAATTAARAGPEEIPHDLANRKVIWTQLLIAPDGVSQPLDPALAAAIDQAWAKVRSGTYPAVTLPMTALPPRKEPCAKTLTLTTPVVAGDFAFERWSDGTNRRTMALRKSTSGWTVIAEGPALIG